MYLHVCVCLSVFGVQEQCTEPSSNKQPSLPSLTLSSHLLSEGGETEQLFKAAQRNASARDCTHNVQDPVAAAISQGKQNNTASARAAAMAIDCAAYSITCHTFQC